MALRPAESATPTSPASSPAHGAATVHPPGTHRPLESGGSPGSSGGVAWSGSGALLRLPCAERWADTPDQPAAPGTEPSHSDVGSPLLADAVGHGVLGHGVLGHGVPSRSGGSRGSPMPHGTVASEAGPEADLGVGTHPGDWLHREVKLDREVESDREVRAGEGPRTGGGVAFVAGLATGHAKGEDAGAGGCLPGNASVALATDCVGTDAGEMLAGLGGGEVRRRLARAARHEETSRRVLAFYLVEMERRRLYQGTGHGSTGHYAEARLALDRRRTAELLRVGAQLLELRQVDRAFCEGRLGWGKVLIVARMATPEHEAAWLERALALDVRALALLAARSREGGPPRVAGDEKGLPEIRFPVSVSVGALVQAKLEQAQRRLGAELSRPVDLAGLLDTLLDQFLATEAAEAVGTAGAPAGRQRVDASAYRVELYESGKRGDPLLVMTEEGPMPVDGGGPGREGALSEAVRCDAGVRNHHVAGPAGAHGRAHGHAPASAHGHDTRAHDVKTPAPLRGRVLRRDGHRCRSCRSRFSLMVHHKEFRLHGGRTLPHNLITLCSRCHGLVHAGLLVIEGATVDDARFLDAEGQPVDGGGQVAALEQAAAETLCLTPPAPIEGASAGGVSPTDEGVRAGARGQEGVVTLARVPAELDPTWWRRHAHLVRDRGDGGSLCFRSGTPEEVEASPVTALPPADGAFDDLVGQDERVRRLRETAAGSKALGRRFPHTLLTGPAGTGKTTLARAIAAAAGQPLAEVSAPLLRDRVTWVRFLAGLPECSVLFLDEAHALPLPLLDVLLEALTERRLSLVLSDGERARHVRLRLPSFTLVAATTDEGAIPAALRSRFGLRETLVHYSVEALTEVALKAAVRMGASDRAGGGAAPRVELTPEGAGRVAQAARGTPREVHRLLDRAWERVARTGTVRVDRGEVERLLAGLGYDPEGLDAGEQRYLQVLRQSPSPVPLSRLARVLGTTPRTLIEHVEPWLFERGLVRMTPGGRAARSRARLLGSVDGDRAAAFAEAPNVRRGVSCASRAP